MGAGPSGPLGGIGREELIAGLQPVIGKEVSEEAIGELLSAEDFGHVYAVCVMWNRLGLA